MRLDNMAKLYNYSLDCGDPKTPSLGELRSLLGL
jgi:hypothetical protein